MCTNTQLRNTELSCFSVAPRVEGRRLQRSCKEVQRAPREVAPRLESAAYRQCEQRAHQKGRHKIHKTSTLIIRTPGILAQFKMLEQAVDILPLLLRDVGERHKERVILEQGVEKAAIVVENRNLEEGSPQSHTRLGVPCGVETILM